MRTPSIVASAPRAWATRSCSCACDRFEAHLVEIVNGRAQTHRLRDRHGARLELVRRRRKVERSIQTLSIISPPPRKGGMASSSSRRAHSTPIPDGPSILWPEKPRKSAPSSGTFTGSAAPTERRRPAPARRRHGPGRRSPHRRDGAQHVGLVDHGDELGPLVDQLARCSRFQPALVGHAEPAQRRAGALAQLLPRDQVGVVLHLGDHDLVAGADRNRCASGRRVGRVAYRVGDQVDGFGSALGEDDLGLGVGAEELRDLDPRALVGVGRLLAEQVRARCAAALCSV